MKYLNSENIIQIHFEIIEEAGGLHGLRDGGLLQSALERPKASFAGKDLYSSIFLKAASLAHSLILNHPFADGNKRTAVLSAIIFFQLNRKDIRATQEEIVDFALWVENKKPEIEEIADWFRKRSRVAK